MSSETGTYTRQDHVGWIESIPLSLPARLQKSADCPQSVFREHGRSGALASLRLRGILAGQLTDEWPI